MNILAIDVGGTHVKVLASDQTGRRVGSSPGPPDARPDGGRRCKRLTRGLVATRRLHRLPGPGGARPDRGRAKQPGPRLGRFRLRPGLRLPVKLINDAAMQALGSYEGGRMLFLGLGTGLGSAMIVDGHARAHGTGPSALPKGQDLRGLRRVRRIGTTGQRSGASTCGPSSTCFRTALEPDDHRRGRRQRPRADRTAPGRPPWAERECFHRRFSALARDVREDEP